MASAEALEQDNNARECVTGEKTSETQTIDPSVWLRGEVAEAWQSIERRPDVAACLPRRPSHDKATDDRATSCTCDIQVFGDTTPSSIDGTYTPKPCDLVTPKSSSARSSVRLNRFERHPRYSEDMHLLIIRRQLKQQSDGELKFRTDFEACFREFPLDKAFEPHWTCRTPVSAQASSVRSRTRTPQKSQVDQQPTVAVKRDEDVTLDECNVYEFAKVNGLMNDILLPRNSDGTLMAELDASPTDTSFTDVTSVAKHSPPASIVVNTSAGCAPHVRSERLARKLAALRPLSWTKRASIHLKQIRRSSVQVQQECTSDSRESGISTIASPWSISATADGVLYQHSALDKVATPATAMSFTFDTGRRTSALLAQHLSMQKECGESDSESDDESVAVAEEVVVGGCWVSIASHEQ